MFDFDYTISISVLHPTIDPREISMELGLQPSIERTVGKVVRNKAGKSLGRKATTSHWFCKLTDKGLRKASETEDLSRLIQSWLIRLKKHEAFLRKLKTEGGSIKLLIGWFSRSRNSAGEIDAEVLRVLGLLGIDLSLDIYFQRQNEEEQVKG